MKCPHCLVEFHDKVREYILEEDVEGGWGILAYKCPSCERSIFKLARGEICQYSGGTSFDNPTDERLIRPKTSNRPPVPPQVPDELAADYREACLVLADSPKASAALSRRCLQHILREKAGVTKGNLANEIEQMVDSKALPSYISESLDAIRNIGNFAAHPIKSESTGEIVPVEPGEAEWNLDVIETLYDFFFVQPDIVKKKREALNQKLADAGQRPMK